MGFEFNPRVEQISSYPSTELAKKKKRLQEQGKKIFDFGAGDPIEPTAAFIREAVGKNVPVVSQYPKVWGVPELRESIRAYLRRRFAVELDAVTEILPCTGSKEAIFNAAFLLTGLGMRKNVIIGPAPGYFVMGRSALIAGAEYHTVELNEENNFLMELGEVSREVLKRCAIAWINYPHNPTGAECDLPYLERQSRICREYGILLCSDECYVDLYFSATPPPSILQVTREGVLAFHSCSKRSGMTAYRSGFIAGDKEVLKLYGSYRDNLGVAAPVYTQFAAASAWSDDAHCEERREYFRKKRELFEGFFKSQGLHVTKSAATFYYWIKAPSGFDGSSYADKLLQMGIIVSPGESFAPHCKDYFRVALVPSLDDCRKALELWTALK